MTKPDNDPEPHQCNKTKGEKTESLNTQRTPQYDIH